MKRSNLLFAAGLLALPAMAFAQGTADSKAAQPGVTASQSGAGQGGTTAVQPGPVTGTAPSVAAKNNPVKTESTPSAVGVPKAELGKAEAGKAAVKGDAPAKAHAGAKSTSTGHAHAASPADGHVKQPEAPKS